MTIIEDPLSEKSVGYRIFDDEGTSTQYKEIVKDGVLKTYLVDQKTASQDHIFATGNYYGGISTRNMYLKSGDSSFSELVKKLDNGIISGLWFTCKEWEDCWWGKTCHCHYFLFGFI